MKRFLILVLSALIMSCTSNPGSAGAIDQTSFQDTLDGIVRDDKLARSISGCIINGTQQYTYAANKDGRAKPVSTDMYFGIASMTKTFVAACIYHLIESNQLTLDRNIDTIFLETPIEDQIITGLDILYNEDFYRVVPKLPILNFLNHTSGIKEFDANSYWVDAIASDKDAYWDQIRTLDYIGAYDTTPSYNYQNTNYLVLGLAVEKLSGMDIKSYLHDHILTPNGLSNTRMKSYNERSYTDYTKYTKISDQDISPVATGYVYSRIAGTYTMSDYYIGSGNSYYSAIWTSANIFSKCDDMAKWAKIYYNYLNNFPLQYGGTQIIIPELFDMDPDPDVDTRNHNQSYYTPYGSDGYNFDIYCGRGIKMIIFNDHNGVEQTLFGHTGSMFGFSGSFWYWPSMDLSFAVLANSDNIDPYNTDNLKIIDRMIQYIKN